MKGVVALRENLHDFCIRTGRKELLAQWYSTRNLPLTPETVSSGSKRRPWWHCEHGHEWQAAVYSRTSTGTKCPYCAGKLPVPGENDLATLYPHLANEWHPTKNAPLTSDRVLPGSHRMVWWVCKKGHEWQAIVKSRTSGSGCPVCANRAIQPGDNDLQATRPDLAAQWHPTKNGALTPHDVTEGSHRKVWWRCEKEHEWQALVSSRAENGTGCPVCAGKAVLPGENDLPTLFPEIAAQWYGEKNGALKPEQVSPYSNRKVWWWCKKGHPYHAMVAARTMHNSGCPYCAGKKVLPGFNDLATVNPEIAAQWHPTLNGNLTPEMVTVGSCRRVWWLCSDGHVWKAIIYSRTGKQKCGCPVCAGKVKPDRAAWYRRLAAEAGLH